MFLQVFQFPHYSIFHQRHPTKAQPELALEDSLRPEMVDQQSSWEYPVQSTFILHRVSCLTNHRTPNLVHLTLVNPLQQNLFPIRIMKAQQQPKISVVIRKRPLNRKEVQRNQTDVIAVKNSQTVIVSEYKQKVDLTKYIEESIFNFDFAFDETMNNQHIYNRAVKPLVQSAFLGAKVTCFAYGQTGSGKTYTMNGDANSDVPGLYVLGAQDLFSIRNSPQHKGLKIYISFFEIYCGKLFDLLNSRNELKLRQDNKQNVNIVGLEEHEIFSPEEFMSSIATGSTLRITSENSTNAVSSRSHAILQIALKEGKKLFGKISFIDLAGSQRGADHMDQNKQTRIDGAQINKSLLALKECIRALDQGKGHTPFRGSKLTMVLKDSFVGFCKTVMIGNISPGLASCENTLNTLRYADRVKELKKGAEKGGNQSISKEDQLAKELMLPRMNKNAVKIMIDKDDDAQDIQNKKKQAYYKLMGPSPTNQKDNFADNHSMGQLNQANKPNVMNNQSALNSAAPKKIQQANKVKKYTIGGQQKRSESLSVKNSMTSTQLRFHNIKQNSKTNALKQQDQSPPKINKMSVSVTNKTLTNKKELPAQQSIRVNSNASFQKLKGAKQKEHPQRQTSLRTKGTVFNSSAKGKLQINLATNSNTQNLKLMRHQSEEHKKELDSKRKTDDDKWHQIVNDFRQWHPTTEGEMNQFKEAHQFLINKLIQEQDEITAQHSLTINREIQVIKHEWQFISDIEKDKGSHESIEYVEFMQNSIDSKLKSLLELKKRVNMFKEKLLEHQQCEEKIFMAKEQLAEEQLLDDLEDYDTVETQGQS